jgi:hypothetical protein
VWLSTVVTLLGMLVAGIASESKEQIGTAILGLVAAILHPPWGNKADVTRA